MNYTVKGALLAGLSKLMSQSVPAARAAETVSHAMVGMLSGAEYISLQQEFRSMRPDAKMTAVHTREVFKAQAAYLESLHTDLKAGLGTDAQPSDSPPDEATLRALSKESARIAKDLAAVQGKARFAGIASHEFMAQFEGEAKWDTLSEVVGRYITLLPVSAVTDLTAAWRKSPDPLWMFLGHFVPSVVLMLPLPLPVGTGFTGRPWVCGLIRAGIQSFLVERTTRTVAIQVPNLGSATLEEVTVEGDDHAENKNNIDGHDSIDSVEVSSASTTSSTDVSTPSSTSSTDSDADSSDQDSTVEGSSADSSDTQSWDGNPTERDKNAVN